ncbi:MAG: flagellar hook-length control protein FliK [Thermodesulfovibrionales bacterium]
MNAVPQKGDGPVTQVSSDSPAGNSEKSGFSSLVDSLSAAMGANGGSPVSQKSADAGKEPNSQKLLKDSKTPDGKSGIPGEVNPQINRMAVSPPNTKGSTPAGTADGKPGIPGGANPQMNRAAVSLPNTTGSTPAGTADDKPGIPGGASPQMNGTSKSLMNTAAATLLEAKTDVVEVTDSGQEPIDQTSVSQDKQNLQPLLQEVGKLQGGDGDELPPMASHDSQNLSDTAGGQKTQGPQKGDGSETKDSKTPSEFDSLLSLKSLSGKGQSVQLGASANENSQNADDTKTTAHDNDGSSSNSAEPLNSANMGFSQVVRQENTSVPNVQAGPSEATTVKPNVTDITDGKVYVMKDSNNLSVTLEPDGLGKLNIQLSLDKGMITTQISVPDNAVKSLIENNIQHIVHSLMNEGLSVGGFSVSLRDGQGTGTNESQYAVSRRGSDHSMSNTPEITESAYDGNSQAVSGLINIYI